MKRVLFRKILFSYLIFVPLLVISLELYLSTVIKESYISKLKDSLAVKAHLIADEIPPSFNLDDFCKEFKKKTGAGITIIDSRGRLLGDSNEPSDKVSNHLDREEIKNAAISGIGSSIQKDLFYFAIAINKPDKGFLRLSVPLHDIETSINRIRVKVIGASLSALFIVVLIGLIQTRRITKSIEEVTDFSKEIASGNFKRRLFSKEKGELGELAKNISDIAQEFNKRLKQADEEKLKMETIIRNMSDGLMLVDTKGKILLSNPAIKKFFGINSDIEGKTLMETLRRSELMEVVNSVLGTNQGMSREIEVIYPKELYLMITAAPFLSKQGISGVVLTFHDITKLKQLENVRKDFVASVSHEIRTPITAIKGFAETLLEGAIDDKENAYKFLETIKNQSERLNSLVSDLLTLSEIEVGDIKIEKKLIDLNDVVDTVFATLTVKAQLKGLYLKKEIPHSLKIKADSDRLIQILLNLVDNAVKFTEKGGVTVKVKSDEEKDFCEISVEDTGIGIPKEHLHRLGERFYRIDKARSRTLGGTGLGLAIVKHLVKAHGWRMGIESTLGKGTKVKIFVHNAFTQ